MRFIEKLAEAVRKNNSLVCVGLDPDPGLMPEGKKLLEFNRAIIEATSDMACAFKPNLAFYEALGMEGWEALRDTVKSVPSSIPVIADAKRGDIGNTARAYARAIFDYFEFDACTVNPYLGFDAAEPFLEYREKLTFVLCRTSNAGAADFQSLRCETQDGPRQLYEVVAARANAWSRFENLGLVVGATYPEELKAVRASYPDMPFLVPGIGAQGGDVALTIANGLDTRRERTVINSSRQILYASRGKDFAEAARKATQALRDQINQAIAGLA